MGSLLGSSLKPQNLFGERQSANISISSRTTYCSSRMRKKDFWFLKCMKLFRNLQKCYRSWLYFEVYFSRMKLPSLQGCCIVRELLGNRKTKLCCHVLSSGCKSHVCLFNPRFLEKTDLGFLSLSDTFSLSFCTLQCACSCSHSKAMIFLPFVSYPAMKDNVLLN